MHIEKQAIIFEELEEVIVKDDESLEEKRKLNMRKGHSFLYLRDGETIVTEKEHAYRWCVWESGGAYTNTGESTIICGAEGQKLVPKFIPSSGHLACGEHAMFIQYEDQPLFAVEVNRHRDESHISLIEIMNGQEKVVWDCDYDGSGIENLWNMIPNKYERFSEAIGVALDKSYDYHCRHPYYYIRKTKND
jgi:hypothetical protein